MERRLSKAPELEPPLEVLATLWVGIANDINTPAQYVADNLSFLRRTFEKLLPLLEAQSAVVDAARIGTVPPSALQAVDVARRSARLDYVQRQLPRALEQSLHGLSHISASMRALKELARAASGRPEATDLNELVETAATLAKSEWTYVAELQLDFDWNLPQVMVLRRELLQLLLSLIVNAARGVAAGQSADTVDKGNIRITTRSGQHQVELCLSVEGAPMASLSLPALKP